MRLELALIPMIFAVAVSTLAFIKPIQIYRVDLSPLFIYWPEALRYAEMGDPTAVYRVTGLVRCSASGPIEAPPGVAYRALNLSCRFSPW
ncbi:hypothetical protein [Pyrobaculum neutrophilum]|uniref:Uncharacterized protein n=1 Tax=Pyrobaculum neutrophilum (strain DSM 2338 / JCM 9278 / NBRC 100436 / V24Sta) TaxID=444157 RepID=B1Y8Q9_PYRNV|nr:hypothetical protein [Pyrobaculum neutrophilum]ACB40138.1 conserved hypothetical protein [Pyrobaculum neutrophilum V24Sta]